MKVIEKIKDTIHSLWKKMFPGYEETPHEALVHDIIVKTLKHPLVKTVLFADSGTECLIDGYVSIKDDANPTGNVDIVLSNSTIYIKNGTDFIELYCRPAYAGAISKEIISHIDDEVKNAKSSIDICKEKTLKHIKSSIR